MKVNTKEILYQVARRGWTFEQTAKAAGIAVNTFAYIRRNGSCTPRSVYKLAQAFNVPMEYLEAQED